MGQYQQDDLDLKYTANLHRNSPGKMFAGILSVLAMASYGITQLWSQVTHLEKICRQTGISKHQADGYWITAENTDGEQAYGKAVGTHQ